MKKEDKSKNVQPWAKAMTIFALMSSWIVGPVILALLAGRWLDGRFGEGNFFTLTAVGFAFIITCVGIGREALKVSRDWE